MQHQSQHRTISTAVFREAMRRFSETSHEKLAFGNVGGGDGDFVDAASKTGTPLVAHFVDVLNEIIGELSTLLRVDPEDIIAAAALMKQDHRVSVMFDVPVREPNSPEECPWGPETVFGSALAPTFARALERAMAGERAELGSDESDNNDADAAERQLS